MIKFASLFKRTKKKKGTDASLEKIYYSPAADMSAPWLYAGLVLRALVLYIGVFGITAFICGAAGLTASSYWNEAIVTPGKIALLSIPVAIAAAVASIGPLFAAIVPFIYVGATIGIYAINYGNPFSFIYFSVLRIYNYALSTISARGYYQFTNYMISDGYDYSGIATYDPYRFAGVFILASLIGLILYFCIQKKTRMFPIALLMTIVIAPILTYNIAVGNSGIAFMIVFVCAAMALKVYDYRYGGKAEAVAKAKKEKADKKTLRQKRLDEKKREKLLLRAEADSVYDRAIDADIPLSKAKQARRAVYRNHKDSKRREKKQLRLKKQLEKKNAKKQRAEQKQHIKSLQKAAAKMPKNSPKKAETLAEIKALKDALNEKKAQKRDEKKQKKAEKRKIAKIRQRASMAGGYAGAGVALIAFLAVWLPLSLAKTPFTVIKPINDRVQTVRAYVTAYLRGSDVDLNDPYVYGLDFLAPRELSFEPLELTDRLIFQIEAGGKSNVYMRSWAATYYDWFNNQWYSASYPDLYKYRELFGSDFTPDSIKTDFYSYVYPSSTVIKDENTYKNFSKYGFTLQQLNVWRVSGQSLLIFVPSFMNTDAGILEFETLNKSPYKYQNYFDGTYSSFHIKYGTGYSTLSYVTAYNREDTRYTIDQSLEYYRLCAEAITASPDAEGEEAQSIVTELEWTLNELGIEYLGASIADRYYFSMNDTEKKKFLESIEAEEKYRSYVGETYTEKSSLEPIAQIAAKIKEDAIAKELENGGDGILTRHETALAVVEYLRSDEFYFTETPNKKLIRGNKPVILSFLTDVKQGYCSHFASAATILLREMDVPARYVEGYVADDFEAQGVNGSKYFTEVNGTDAHAWVEIYIDGIGWMQYEVTPGKLSDDMYDPNSDTIAPEPEEDVPEDGTENSGGTAAPEKENEEKLEIEVPDIPAPVPDEGEDQSDLVLLLKLITAGLIIAAVATAVYLVIRYIRKRAQKAMAARYEVIDTAKNRDAFTQNTYDRHGHARSINDWIIEVYALIGCEPRPGELPSEFVIRMREDYGDLSRVDVGLVIEAMQKEEFGHGLNVDEMCALAEYLEDIITSVYAGMNIWQKIVNRYFRRKI